MEENNPCLQPKIVLMDIQTEESPFTMMEVNYDAEKDTMTSAVKKKNKQKFCESWLQLEMCQDWLIKVVRKGGDTPYCTYCELDVHCSITAIKRHSESNRHLRSAGKFIKVPNKNKAASSNSASGSEMDKYGALNSFHNEIPCETEHEADNEAGDTSEYRKEYKFCDRWLDIPEFSDWLIKMEHKGRDIPHCFSCRLNLNCSLSGIKSHAKSQRHKRNEISGDSLLETDTNNVNGISRFPVPDVGSVPEDLRDMMKETLEKAGFIPNNFQALAHRPAELKAFISYYEVVMDDKPGSKLTKADKEMINVAVSAHNKCQYGVIAHSAMFRIFSRHTTLADQIAANWETANLDSRQKAILRFALQIAQCLPLKEAHFQALYHHGLTQEDAWDIGSVVSLFSLSNRMALLTNLVPNEEFFLLGRVLRPQVNG